MTALLPAKPPQVQSENAPKPSRRRRLLTLLGGIVILGGLFAPMIIAKSPLRHRILPMLLPDYPGEITTGDASLMWWSGVSLSDVQFEDTEGQPFLQIENITSEKSLVALIADQVHAGGFRITKPHLMVRLTEDGSNLETTIAPLLAPSEDSEPLDIAFQIREGRVEIEAPKSQRKSQLENLQADVHLPADASEAMTVRGTTDVGRPGSKSKAGSIEFDLAYRTLLADSGESTGDAATLRLKTGDLHLEALSAMFARFDPNMQVTGVMVSDLATEWSQGEAGTVVKLDGGLNATNVSVAAPTLLGGDQFRLDYLTHEGALQYASGELQVTDLAIKSDLLSCTANGSLNPGKFIAAWKSRTGELSQDAFALSGEVNLARIARMFPETLRLRDGLSIETGVMTVGLNAGTQNGEQQLSGQLQTSEIVAVANGERITWDRPLEIALKARHTSGGPVLDELTCRADFLSLWAKATPDDATFKAACQLDQLMQELNRFSDLESYRVAGRIDAGLTVRRLSSDLLRGAASAVVKNFRLAVSGEQPTDPWEEPQLVLAAGGDLVTAPEGTRQIQNLSVRLSAGSDELQLSQTAPVTWSNKFPAVGVMGELRGELDTWRNRLRPFVSTAGLTLKGNITASMKAKISKAKCTLESVVADCQNLRVTTAALDIQEPRVHLETRGEWTAENNRLFLSSTTWASPSLSLRADEVESITSSNGIPRTSGRVVFRGGVSELSRWFRLNESLGPNLNVSGTASGQLDLTMTDQAADANWNVIIENAVLASLNRVQPPPGAGFRPVTDSQPITTTPVWSENRIAFRGGGVYEFPRDRIALRPTQLESPWLFLSASGNLDEVSTRGVANLSGNLTCNLPVLTNQFRETLGTGVTLVGNETRPFSVRGPLWGADPNQRVANDLTAFLSIPWQQIMVYGIPIGPSELRADVNLGTLQLGPLNAAVGTGAVKFNSRLGLNTPDLTMQIDKGPLLENVRLTQDVSREWVGYAVPILADSTEVDGLFSTFLTSNAVVPLSAPETMTATGVIGIQSAQMRPGELAKAFLEVAQQVKTLVRGRAAGAVLPADQTLLRLEPQNVNVQCANGRVYHQQLKLVLADIPITTSGSVGFDETLSMTAEIPVQDSWVRDNRFLAGLRGQTLKIPVGGTLSKPQLDTRAVYAELQRAAQNATGRLIENELENQFNRLFK